MIDTPASAPTPSAWRGSRDYAAGAATALAASLLLVWTQIVRDDGGAAAVFMVILAAGVGAFATRFQAPGMARALLGVGAMQVALGLLVATAPVTATQPDGVAMALFYHGFFAAMWLAAAACFRAASRPEAGTTPLR
jgi:hypothetical protein